MRTRHRAGCGYWHPSRERQLRPALMPWGRRVANDSSEPTLRGGGSRSNGLSRGNSRYSVSARFVYFYAG